MIPKNSAEILILDLTENNFNGSNDLRFLFEFPNLKTLVLDKNKIQSNFIIPEMPNLTTLWVNHNSIENLSVFIENVCRSCPNLTYLSMLNNKAAPSYFNGGSLIEYNDYRLYVISKLLKLKMLDDKEITEQDRQQSQAIYGTGRLVRFNDRRNSQIVKSKRKSTKKAVEKIEEIQVKQNVNNAKEVSNDIGQITDENKVSSAEEIKKRKNKILEKTIQTEISSVLSETQKIIEKKIENEEIELVKKTEASEDLSDILEMLPQLPDEIDLPETFEPIKQNHNDLNENMSYSLPSLSNSIELSQSQIDSLPLVSDFSTFEPPLPQSLSYELDDF